MTTAPLSTHMPLITDNDNPLIERKYPRDGADSDSIKLPQLYYLHFTNIPNFSQPEMPSAYFNISEDLGNAAESDITAQQSSTTLVNANKSSNAALDPTSLSSPQAIAQATAQAKLKAKAIQQQKQLEEEQHRAQEVAHYHAEVEAALLNPTLHVGLLNQRQSIADAKAVITQHTIFSEFAQDLQTIDLAAADISATAKPVYEQAVMVIQAPESGDAVDREDVSSAIQVIEKFAEDGIADALLRKALWLFEGNRTLNVTQNEQEALALLQLVANQGDNRAEKLLSKLYYAGHLVEQDSDLGKFWLDLAADHGHPEAIRISQGIATVSLLQQAQREDNRYTKKMRFAIVALIIGMVLIFMLVKI